MPSAVAQGQRQISFTHPTYAGHVDTWTKLRDVRDGGGGFETAEYLIGHPREYVHRSTTRTVEGKLVTEVTATTTPTKKLKARRKLASYENIAERIVEAFASALGREQPSRRIGDEEDEPPAEEAGTEEEPRPKPATRVTTEAPPHPLEAWWENVDGAGTQIDDYMTGAWDNAATFGHVILYLDRAPADAETAADEPMPFLRAYTPLDVLDWMVDDVGQLTAVKFQEIAPRESLETAYVPEVQIRVVDAKGWRLYDKSGALKTQGDHAMGVCPVVALYTRRAPFDPVLGVSILGDPRLYIDLFNLVSEVRELLRNQTFGILNVPLGTGDNAMSVSDAQITMGKIVGTENVLFSGLAAGFIQPSAENVTVYHEELNRKLRTIYRLVGVPWESDSKDAEAEGSLEAKREDLNQRLSKFADEMERADYKLAELFFRATQGADKGAKAVEKEKVVIKYPDQFDMTPFEALIEEAQAARDLGMGATFMKELRKMLLGKFTGMADLPESVKAQILKEIASAPADLTPAEQAQQRMDLVMGGLKSGAVKPPKPPKPKIPAEPAA